VNRGAVALAKKTRDRGDQRHVADKADLDEGYLSRLVRGERIPGLRARQKLLANFGIPMEWWDEPTKEPAA